MAVTISRTPPPTLARRAPCAACAWVQGFASTDRARMRGAAPAMAGIGCLRAVAYFPGHEARGRGRVTRGRAGGADKKTGEPYGPCQRGLNIFPCLGIATTRCDLLILFIAIDKCQWFTAGV